MKSIRALIVDDEPAAVEVITALLRQFSDDAEVVGIARDGLEAVQHITRLKPDLIFLDVDMPVMNGLQVLEKVPAGDFEVIFTTGSSGYALQALKLKAVDYLLKPIDPAEFIVAVDRARQQLQLRQQAPANTVSRIQLPTQNGIIYLDEGDIAYVSGMGSYCQIHTTANEKITLSKNIGQMEAKLSPERFFRCHNSHIINLDFVAKFLHREGFSVEMKDGTIIEVSRRCKEGLLAALAGRSR